MLFVGYLFFRLWFGYINFGKVFSKYLYFNFLLIGIFGSSAKIRADLYFLYYLF